MHVQQQLVGKERSEGLGQACPCLGVLLLAVFARLPVGVSMLTPFLLQVLTQLSASQVKPTSSFVLSNMPHPPYTTINFVHNTDHLLTYYVKGCVIFCTHTHTPPHTHTATEIHTTMSAAQGRVCHLKYLEHLNSTWYVGGAQNLLGEKMDGVPSADFL